jgi:hypothetical protein
MAGCCFGFTDPYFTKRWRDFTKRWRAGQSVADRREKRGFDPPVRSVSEPIVVISFPEI